MLESLIQHLQVFETRDQLLARGCCCKLDRVEEEDVLLLLWSLEGFQVSVQGFGLFQEF